MAFLPLCDFSLCVWVFNNINIQNMCVCVCVCVCVCQGRPLALPAMRALVRVRLALAQLSLTMLEQVCVAEKRLALAQDRKGSVERTLEEFGRSTPDLNSLEQVSPIVTDRVFAHEPHSSYCEGISYNLSC